VRRRDFIAGLGAPPYQSVVVDVGMKDDMPPAGAGWLWVVRQAWRALAPMQTAKAKTMIATLRIRPLVVECMRPLHWLPPADENCSRHEI
jgi:hypothetical protein